MWRLIAFTIAAIAFILPIYYLNAQEILPGYGVAITIAVSPQHPEPGDSVTLRVESTAIDLSSSDISWAVNGKTIAHGVGVSEATLDGNTTNNFADITVNVTAQDGTYATASLPLVPTRVDLLYDSNSYVPAFYRGRRLPSAGTTVQLEARPHFVTSKGFELSNDHITFEWKRNGAVIKNASGTSRSSTHIAAPLLYGNDTISVDAASDDGVFVGHAETTISSVDPSLVLYQDHPLFGLMNFRSIDSEVTVPESEMTFAAIPYFAEAVTANDSSLDYAWRVNGVSVPATSTAPSELTLSAGKTGGAALLQLALSHISNLFLSARGTWQINLQGHASTNGTSAPDPFRSSK